MAYDPEKFAEELKNIKQCIGSVSIRGNELDLEFSELTNQDAQALAEALEHNPTITSLNLKDNQIGDAGAKALAKIKTIRTIDFTSNRVGDVGAQALAQAPHLTRVLLTGNQLSSTGITAIFNSNSLQSFCVAWNRVEQDLVRNMATLVDKHKKAFTTSFLLACQHGCLAIVSHLLDGGVVSPHTTDRLHNTGLHLAAANKQYAIAEYLATRFPMLLETIGQYGRTPLQVAEHKRDARMIALFQPKTEATAAADGHGEHDASYSVAGGIAQSRGYGEAAGSATTTQSVAKATTMPS